MNFLVNELFGPFCGRINYAMLACPTFAYIKIPLSALMRETCTCSLVINCEQHKVEFWLKVVNMFSEGTNTLIVPDDCAASKDVKGRTGDLVKLGFSAHQIGIKCWVLTQQLRVQHREFFPGECGRDRVVLAVGQNHKAIYEEYASELAKDDLKQMISKLKFSKFC